MLISFGCESIDFGDTNKNVNGPSDANTATLMSGAMTNFATRTGRPYRITPTLYVQYFMQFVYNDEMLYAEAPGYWFGYYVQTSSNLQKVIEIMDLEESASNPLVVGNGAIVNQKAVAMIFKTIIFKRATDLFGDIPYFKFLIEGELTPEYDKQELIYKDFITQVKAARDMIDVTLPGPTGDVIYGGDMNAWIKFANSFLMQLSLQLSKQYPDASGYAAIEFKSALDHTGGAIEVVADEAWYEFDVDGGFDNPWSWMRPADYGVSSEFMQALQGVPAADITDTSNSQNVTSNITYDERIVFFTDAPTAEGYPYGYETYASGHVNAPVNTELIDAATDLPLLTAAYTWLNRAEAAELGWTSENVNTAFTSGVMASYESLSAHYTPDISDGSAYAAARILDMGTASGGAFQVIGEEKWVALCPLGYDAWSEWRRTGYPVLRPSVDAYNDGQIPRRYNYPSEESKINQSNYNSGVSSLVPAKDKNTSKIWWDQ